VAAPPASAAHWPAGIQAVVGRRARVGMVRLCAPIFLAGSTVCALLFVFRE